MFKAIHPFTVVLVVVLAFLQPFGCNKAEQISQAASAGMLISSKPISPEELSTAKHAITACHDFAVELYLQLAKENEGQNLFFSPYSMSSALIIAGEGAENETAIEMGMVLRFPDAVRQVGGQAEANPWNTDLIHSGMSILNKRFSPNPIPQAIRDQIETLRKNLDEANREATEFDKADKKREAYLVSLKAQKIAAELNSLLTHVDQYEIRVANGLWGEKTYPFEPSYLEAVRKFYGPDTIFAVDFKNEAESARLRINQSVEHVTNKRIRDLVPPRAITQTTRLILTNAIYFKGEWQDPFEESLTKPADFTITDGTKLRVAMMYDAYMPGEQYAAFNGDGTFFKTPKEVPSGRDPDPKIVYPDTDGFQILEMPYKGGDLSMIVILPQTADGLDRLEKKLSSKNLQNWAGKLEKRQVYVYLPKFRLEATYAMKETLRSLGMSRSFAEAGSLQGAQFNGMSASRAPEFWISEVLHKAFIEVNEKGTEAAAATCIFWGVSEGAMAEPTRPFDPTFRADRPFLFLIRDIQTGTILFLGRILRPQE